MATRRRFLKLAGGGTGLYLTSKFGLWPRALAQIPGGARWAYVFGSALLTAIGIQFVTGALLTFSYVPSIDHAHSTLAYMQKEVPLGWLVRGLHYYGASAVMIVLSEAEDA